MEATMRVLSRLTAGLAAALTIALATGSLTAEAAQITYYGVGKDLGSIEIVGVIKDGDATRFEQVVAAMSEKNAFIVLTSPGGSILDGLSIGEVIRTKGYRTIVIDECSSVCSLIWLAGAVRVVDESSAIGFHAAYTKDGTDVRESGLANAMVGAYLTKLGFSYTVVAFATSTPPEKITWMTAADALRMSVDVKFVSKGPGAAPPSPPALMSPPWSPSQDEEATKKAEQNDRLNASELVLRKQVGAEKVDALIAWFKAAAAKDPSMFQRLLAQPDPYAWAYREFQLQNIPSNPAASAPVASPVATVLSPAQAAAALTPAYVGGREARLIYERWFTALPTGRYRDGASFWASNRSLKTSPSCTNPTQPDWQTGCSDSRTRLAPADALRANDPNYWWGWNSL
jgi:hypothetical protein